MELMKSTSETDTHLSFAPGTANETLKLSTIKEAECSFEIGDV